MTESGMEPCSPAEWGTSCNGLCRALTAALWRVDLIHRPTPRDTSQGKSAYWKAACGESRLSGLDGGKEREFLPIRIHCKNSS